MFQLDAHPSGRHFLQIPGPTNVPDRVLRAMDMPTMDHRGPEFAEIGFAVNTISFTILSGQAFMNVSIPETL